MSDTTPFPLVPDPFEGDPFAEPDYDGPAVHIRPHATLYTLNEVAYLLGLPRRDVEEELIEGVIPGTPVGDDWLISRQRLEAWLDALPTEGGER
jgi:excisionase family DNA binding protein